MSKKSSKTISVQQIKSAIRRPKDQRATLLGLGLNRISKISVLADSPETRGMINKVAHLVRVLDR